MTARRCRSGFTLIEVMVAAAIAAVVVTGARTLLLSVSDSTERLVRSVQASDARLNGERLLHQLVRNVDPDTGTGSIGGDSQRLAFRSWCAVSRGWQEPCSVVLSISTRSDSSELLARLSTGEAVTLSVRPGPAVFRYLGSAEDGGVWFTNWEAGRRSPKAIGLISQRDTVILPIGAAQ